LAPEIVKARLPDMPMNCPKPR